jgi:hypothetical protein
MPVARSSCSVPRVAENCLLGGMLTSYEAIRSRFIMSCNNNLIHF